MKKIPSLNDVLPRGKQRGPPGGLITCPECGAPISFTVQIRGVDININFKHMKTGEQGKTKTTVPLSNGKTFPNFKPRRVA